MPSFTTPVIDSLIESAAASFETDQASAKRFLFRATSLLRARRSAAVTSVVDLSPRGGLASWQLSCVTSHIEEHLTETLLAGDLAQLVGLSSSHFSRAFKISTGMPPLSFVTRRRVEMACQMMLSTDHPLAMIAVTCGLCDQSHLCRVFRRVLGESPDAWRRANRSRNCDLVSGGATTLAKSACSLRTSRSAGGPR